MLKSNNTKTDKFQFVELIEQNHTPFYCSFTKKIGITLCGAYLFLIEQVYDAELRKRQLAKACDSASSQLHTAFHRTLKFINLSFSAKK